VDVYAGIIPWKLLDILTVGWFIIKPGFEKDEKKKSETHSRPATGRHFPRYTIALRLLRDELTHQLNII